MATMLADNQEKVVFQCDMMAQIRKVNKVEYAVFEGHHNNGAAVVDFEIRMRNSFIKKQGNDLIKNDHILMQKRNHLFFFLFEADKNKFVKEEDDTRSFVETGKKKDYQYKIRFQLTGNARPRKKSRLGGTAGEKMEQVEELLRKNGITEVDASSPVESYMRTWKLGHPDQE